METKSGDELEGDESENGSSAFRDVALKVMETLNNPRFLEVATTHLKERNDIERSKLQYLRELHGIRLDHQKASMEQWHGVVSKIFWGRICLSAVTLGAVVFLGYNKILDGGVLATLLAGVIASLFIKPEKKG